MDKEKIDEVIVKVYGMARGAMERSAYDESIVRRDTLDWARAELGYRKPSPELRKAVRKVIFDGLKNDLTTWDIADSVLALVPKDKPPLTCEVHITEVIGERSEASGVTDYEVITRCITGCPACQAKAQREADIKWYEGEHD